MWTLRVFEKRSQSDLQSIRFNELISFFRDESAGSLNVALFTRSILGEGRIRFVRAPMLQLKSAHIITCRLNSSVNVATRGPRRFVGAALLRLLFQLELYPHSQLQDA